MALRFYTQLMCLNLKEAETKIQSELQKMNEWADEFDAHSVRAGALDCRYLKQRYDQGTKKVGNFCESSHRYVSLVNDYERGMHEVLKANQSLNVGSDFLIFSPTS